MDDHSARNSTAQFKAVSLSLLFERLSWKRTLAIAIAARGAISFLLPEREREREREREKERSASVYERERKGGS
jgi:hypothetical protein